MKLRRAELTVSVQPVRATVATTVATAQYYNKGLSGFAREPIKQFKQFNQAVATPSIPQRFHYAVFLTSPVTLAR